MTSRIKTIAANVWRRIVPASINAFVRGAYDHLLFEWRLGRVHVYYWLLLTTGVRTAGIAANMWRKRIVPARVKRFIRNAQDHLRFEWRLRRVPPVFVYQMGKVGNKSITYSLKGQYPGIVIGGAHAFYPSHENPEVRRLYRWARPLHVICPVREPIDRNIDAFFQNFKRDTGLPHPVTHYPLEDLKRLFLSHYHHAVPSEWFDKNILANFGIDVYATPFPARGVATYSRKGIRLLVTRLELSDDEKEAAIKEFLGLNHFRLSNTNITEERDYGPAYRAFKTHVRFPAEFVEPMCNSRFALHFYGREAMDKARARWSEVKATRETRPLSGNTSTASMGQVRD